jgi:general stress protein 26
MQNIQERIFSIIKDYQIAALATISEDGKPWVRYVMITGEKDLTLKFATSLASRKVAHIKNNFQVHVACGVIGPDTAKPFLQIQATAGFTRDETLRQAMWKEFMMRYFKGPDDPDYCIGLIKPYRIDIFSMIDPKREVWEK